MNNMNRDTVKRRQELEARYIAGDVLSDQEAEELNVLQQNSPFAIFKNIETVDCKRATEDINRMYFLAEKLSGAGTLEDMEMSEYKSLIHKYEGYNSFPPEIRALNIMFGI